MKSDQAHVRQAAIEVSNRQTLEDNKGIYLAYEHDPHIAEAGMGAPLRFLLRDLALDKLGEIYGKNFRGIEAVELHPTLGPVYWWNWDRVQLV
jgi:hypothetical protein